MTLETGGRPRTLEGLASFQSLAAKLSRVLGSAGTETLDAAMNTSLEELGRYAGVDVAFVTLVDDNDRVSDDWHWIRDGRDARAPLAGEPIAATFGSATEFLRLGHSVAVADLHEIDLAPSERALATANGLRAIVMAPVIVGSQLLGLVGLQMFDEPHRWDPTTQSQLEIVAQLLVQAVVRTRERGALAVANARARRIAEYIPDGLLLLDLDGEITWASPSFLRMCSVSEPEVVGRLVETVFEPAHHAALRDQVRAVALRHEGWLTAQTRDRRGHARWVDVALRLASEPGSRVPDEIVVSVRDVHDRHLREMRLIQRSDRDALTGLLNRDALERAVTELAANDRVVLVSFCDVDDFKTINDGLGHDTGDDVLCKIAAALRGALRPDDLVARIGGDEFAVVVVGHPEEAQGLGERLVRSVRLLDVAGGDVSVSVGVCGPGLASDMAAMLRVADDAMYEAKRRGKNRWECREST